MKKYIRLLHLWLGLASGLVIVIMAVTGACYAFADEVKTMGIEPVVPAHGQALLSPGELKNRILPLLRDEEGDADVVIYGVTYQPAPAPSMVTFSSSKTPYGNVYVNPYTADDMGRPKGEAFFAWAMAGHRSLWLPPAIGRPIIAWGMVIFVIELLTGLVLWWPKRWSRKAIRQRLQVKANGGSRRLWYDLHNSLGGLILLPILIITLTGLTWSFPWLAKSYYQLVSGKTFQEWTIPVSDTTGVDTTLVNDEAMWAKVCQAEKAHQQMMAHASEEARLHQSIRFDFPMSTTGIYTVVYNPKPGKNYSNDYHFYDRYSLGELSGGGVYGLHRHEINAGDKLFRMSYDIHSGAIAGLPGKLIAFLLSLIAASLPISGCVIWWKKRR